MARRKNIQRPDFRGNSVSYYKTYFSIPMFALLLLSLIADVVLAFSGSLTIWHIAVALLVIIIYLLFFKVTLDLEDGSLLITYGVGLFSDEVVIGEINDFSLPKNRYIKTWLYVPTTQQVLQINFRGGGYILVPTHEPKRLSSLLK